VAVVDTGVDYNHFDLDSRIWTNSSEIVGNGIDDDGNGYIDDVRGWDFINNDNDPMDRNSHGTHVAGTIAGENNGIGVTGVAYNATIMPIQVLSAEGFGSSIAVANGIRYAADNGAHVINLSLGGGFNSSIKSAVEHAWELGSLVIMASGNEGASQPSYPAQYAVDTGVAVGAIDINNNVAGFSNDAGETVMDYVVAPGVNVLSTVPGGGFARFNGTSMATPHVAGVAALLRGAVSEMAVATLESFIVQTANPNFIEGIAGTSGNSETEISGLAYINGTVDAIAFAVVASPAVSNVNYQDRWFSEVAAESRTARPLDVTVEERETTATDSTHAGDTGAEYSEAESSGSAEQVDEVFGCVDIIDSLI
jgi:subtilisin family serine protease